MTELEAIDYRYAIRLARWSAVLGTLGLLTAVFGIGVLLALVAIGCGIVALNHLATLPADNARGVALVGLTAGVLALLMFPLLLATAVPRFIAAREEANHERCYSNLIAIDRVKHARAQAFFRGAEAAGAGEIEKGRLFLRERLKCPSGGKYNVNQPGGPPRCSIPIHNEPPGKAEPPRRLRFS
jgi:hypothetical protein